MNYRPKIAILASGGGSTAGHFTNLVLAGKVNGEVVLVISSKPSSGVLERIKKINNLKNQKIKLYHIGKSNFPPEKNEKIQPGGQTQAEETAILHILTDNQIDIVLLMGYLKKVGQKIVAKYGWSAKNKSVFEASMLNTHPGPLPLTKGLWGIHVQEKVLRTNQKITSHCIYAVDSKYDNGPEITRHTLKIKDGDTPKSLIERIKKSEKKYLAGDINYFFDNKYN